MTLRQTDPNPRRKINSVHSLLVDLLHDLYGAEQMLRAALSRMTDSAIGADVRSLFIAQRGETRRHLDRLDAVFSLLGTKPAARDCRAMRELLAEQALVIVNDESTEAVRDIALLAVARRAAHHLLASYGCARSFADLLGELEVIALLRQSLEEESAMSQRLLELAESAQLAARPDCGDRLRQTG